MTRKEAVVMIASALLFGSGIAHALEVLHKEKVVKLAQQAIAQGKQGQAEALMATAKEARA
jgi:hypothetical protein